MKPHVSEREVSAAHDFMCRYGPPHGYAEMSDDQKRVVERQFIRAMLAEVKTASAHAGGGAAS